MKSIALFIWLVFLSFCACEKDDFASSKCDQKAVLNEIQFKDSPADPVAIIEVEIKGDCLRIKFGSSGCSGDTWKVNLVASEMEYFSLPPQRDARLSLKNDELCEAYFVKEMTFDVKDLRSSGDKTILNIVNADTSVLYKY